MRGFSRAETADMIEDLGGALSYTIKSTSEVISGGYAIYNPSTELFDDSSSDKVNFLLLREDQTDTSIIGVPRPTHNDIIVYTDPDDASVHTFWVDALTGSDTYTWRVEARERK